MRFVGLAIAVSACAYHAPSDTAGDDASAIDAPGDVSAPIPDSFVCPTGYATLSGGPSGSVYRVSGAGGGTNSPSAGRSNWLAAELDCRNDGPGTHLAIAETEEEYQALSDAVSGATRWLGVSDRKTEGTWIPIIGGTTTSFVGHWFGDDPNNTCCDATSDCMTLSGSLQTGPFGVINTAEGMPCDSTDPQYDRGYICECDMRSVDSSTF